jgi:hypothetical protein
MHHHLHSPPASRGVVYTIDSLLNERPEVGKRLAGQYAWATVST